MKRNIILIITLSIFSLVFLQDDEAEKNVITGKPTILESSSTAQSITLSCVENSIKSGDEIAFAIGPDYPTDSAEQKHTFDADVKGTSVTFSVTFATGGLYTIFLTRKDAEKHTSQTVTQIVITAVSINSITGITPPETIYPNKQVEIPLAFLEYSLQDQDIITFFKTDNVSLKLRITLDSSFDSAATTFGAKITFPVYGAYGLSITRGKGSEIIQTDKTVTVSPSNPSAKTITKAKPIYKIPETKMRVSLDVNAAKDDSIGFSLLGEELNPDWTLTVGAAGPKVEMDALFDAEGIYNIFYKAVAESPNFALQDIKQRVFSTAISGTTITKVEGTAKAKAEASIKITFAEKTLYDTDKIIFSIGDTIGNDKAQMVLAGVDFVKTEHSQTVKFPKEGTYNVWIQRDTDTAVKQTNTGVQILVAAADPEPDSKEDDGDSSNWLSMSFMILTGLLLL